jgi:medium-chain acyl-[acyl-carrier-protein] hydrolase
MYESSTPPSAGVNDRSAEPERRNTPAQPQITLFCIPHAGGGASAYRNWAQALAPQVGVKVLQSRGRESRFREPPLTELEDVLEDLYRFVEPDTTGPFAFLGHSMGALLTFELAHRLRTKTGRLPVHLFISACRAPNRVQLDTPCSSWPQPEFIAEVMRRYGGFPPQVLADAEFMAAILPAMRADFRILERYRAPERPLLDCPITVFGGRTDITTPQAALEDWQQQTRGAFSLVMLDASHFYLQEKRPAMASKILNALSLAR